MKLNIFNISANCIYVEIMLSTSLYCYASLNRFIPRLKEISVILTKNHSLIRCEL